MKSIDLHMHTKYSDGEYSVEEVLKECESEGLSVVSITDHDAVGAYKEIEENPEIRKVFSGRIIPGTELSFNKDGYLFDVLGYGIDYKKMQNLLDNRMDEKTKKEMQATLLEEWKQVCRNKGIKFDERIETTNGTKSEAFNVLFSDISNFEKYPENAKFAEYISKENRAFFYKRYFSNPNSSFFVYESRFSPSLKEAIDMIHKCGGKAFLAHAFAYGLEDTIGFINYAIQQGIDGIEQYYSTFTNIHENIIRELAERNSLYVSGGTDFHGPNVKTGINIGIGKGNMSIPERIIWPWIPKECFLEQRKQNSISYSKE